MNTFKKHFDLTVSPKNGKEPIHHDEGDPCLDEGFSKKRTPLTAKRPRYGVTHQTRAA